MAISGQVWGMQEIGSTEPASQDIHIVYVLVLAEYPEFDGFLPVPILMRIHIRFCLSITNSCVYLHHTVIE